MEELNEFEKYNQEVDVKTLPMYSRVQLSMCDGRDNGPMYVGIKGYIFDVTGNAKQYGPGKTYNVLVGRDATRLFGFNKLKLPEQSDDSGLTSTTWYYGDLDEKQMGLVDKWVAFFKKRYRIVGVVVDSVEIPN